MVAILRSYGVPHQLVEIIEDLYAGTWSHVRTTEGTSQDFEVKTGVRQGCVLSPLLFNCAMDRILKEVAGTLGGGLQVEYTTAGGLCLTYRDQTKAATLNQDVLYANDLTLIAESRSELQHMLDVLDGACSHWGMTINGEKTKVLTVGDHPAAADQTPTYHPPELYSGRCDNFLIPRKPSRANWKSREASGYKDRESWDSVPDLETKSRRAVGIPSWEYSGA